MTNSLLTDDWLQKLATYHRLWVGFSGGLDSTVLLHSMASQPSLLGKLQAVHVHHGLSSNATAWQTHCEQFCDILNIPLTVCHVEIDSKTNIEESARIARYQAFSALLSEQDGLLLAHHGDDQAETLLLQLFRGSGIDGLAAMGAIHVLTKGELARPLLQHSRASLETYANQYGLTWVDDESNQNCAFSRNYLRHQVMPLLQKKWPGVVSNLARSATHCQQAKKNLGALATIDCVELSERRSTLDISNIQTLDYPRLANVLRVWLQNNKVRLPSASILNRLINEAILVRPDAMPTVTWGTVAVRRYQQRLYLLKNELPYRLASVVWPGFPEPLHFEDGQYLYASADVPGLQVPAGRAVHVRFRQGGELFYWRGQTKQLKKLWQEWQVPPWERDLIPLLYIGDDLAVVVGFAVSDHYFSMDTSNTYHVELRSGAASTIMD